MSPLLTENEKNNVVSRNSVHVNVPGVISMETFFLKCYLLIDAKDSIYGLGLVS